MNLMINNAASSLSGLEPSFFTEDGIVLMLPGMQELSKAGY